MIGKIIKGKGFRGAVNYLFFGNEKSRDKHAEIVASNMAGKTPRELASEFSGLRKLRPTLTKAVCHISLSLSPDDRKLNNQEFGEVAETFLKEMGFDSCPFVAVRHQDTEHPHIHIVVSRIKCNAEVISDKQDFQRAENIIRQLESKYGLRAVLPSTHTPKKWRNRSNKNQGEINMNAKNNLTNELDKVFARAKTIKNLVPCLNDSHITFKPTIDDAGKVIGLSYKYQGKWIKASRLGADYQWPAISTQYGLYTNHISSSLLGQVSQQSDILDNQVSNLDTDDKLRKQRRRNVMDPLYIENVWKIFDDEITKVDVGDGSLTLTFESGGKMIDEGESIYCTEMDDAESADKMIKLALSKNWKKIELRGNDNFLRLAMEKAIKTGIEVSPINDKQAKILAEVKLKINQDKAMLELNPAAPELGEVVDDDTPEINLQTAKDRLLGKRALESDAFRPRGPSRNKGV